MKNTKFVVL